jgi:hypothetical protein
VVDDPRQASPVLNRRLVWASMGCVRVLIVGDLHCDTAAASKVIAYAADMGADVIVRLATPGSGLAPSLGGNSP